MDQYCDGLGACLGECLQGAIAFEEREAEEFDEKAVEENLKKKDQDQVHCGCPGTKAIDFSDQERSAGREA